MIFKLRILLKYRNIELPRDHPWYTLGLFKFLDTQLPHVGIFTTLGIFTRVPPIFFDQVGYQTANASIENKCFFTK